MRDDDKLGVQSVGSALPDVNFPLSVKMVMIDLDGTLIDTVPDLAAAANRMLRELGREDWGIERYRTWVGDGVPRFVKRALTGDVQGCTNPGARGTSDSAAGDVQGCTNPGARGTRYRDVRVSRETGCRERPSDSAAGDMQTEPEPQLFDQALALFRRNYGAAVSELSRPYPGVIDALTQFASEGYQLVCITNKADAFTVPLLKNLDLYKYFGLVLSGDSLPRKKPDPLPLNYACQHFGIGPDRGVLVGDSLNDVQAARAAGMPVICVTYGYNHGHDIRDAGPDATVDSLADVPRYLKCDA